MNEREEGSSGATPITGVRLPVDVRDELRREAEINRRSLSAEILHRLRLTLHGPALTAKQSRAAAKADPAPDKPQSDLHRMLVALFDAMPPDKQLALLTVLRK